MPSERRLHEEILPPKSSSLSVGRGIEYPAKTCRRQLSRAFGASWLPFQIQDKATMASTGAGVMMGSARPASSNASSAKATCTVSQVARTNGRRRKHSALLSGDLHCVRSHPGSESHLVSATFLSWLSEAIVLSADGDCVQDEGLAILVSIQASYGRKIWHGRRQRIETPPCRPTSGRLPKDDSIAHS